MRYFKVMTLLLLIRLILLPQSGEGFQTEIIRLRLVREIVISGNWVSNIGWSFDGRFLSVTTQDEIFLWETESWEFGRYLTDCNFAPNTFEWSPNDSDMAAGCSEMPSPAQVDNLNDINYLIKFDTADHAVAWSPDGKQIAVSQPDMTIGLIDANTLTVLDSFGTPCIDRLSTASDYFCGGNRYFIWSPDGRYIGVGYREMGTRVEIWDIETNQLIRSLGTEAIVWLQGGRVFALTDSIWEISSMTQIANLADGIYSLESSPDGQYLAYCVYNEQFHIMRAGLWVDVSLVNLDDPDAGFPCQTIDMAWSATGMIALAEQDGTIQIWEIVTDPPTPSALAAKVIQCVTDTQLRDLLIDQIATDDWQAFEQSVAAAQNREMIAVCGVQLRDMMADLQN